MMIQVNYSDNRYDFVQGQTLDRLIEADKIRRFRRSSGWVTVGVDPIRTTRREYARDRDNG